MSQTVYQIADKLDSAGLISRDEKKEFIKARKEREAYLEKMKDKGVSSVEEEMINEPYYPLRILQEIKMGSTPGIFSAITFTPHVEPVPKDKEGIVARQLTQYADKLFTSGYISTKTRKTLASAIQKLELRSEYELIAFAAEKTEIEFFLTLPQYQKFADGLLERKLVSKEGYDEIIAKIKSGAFSSYDEPLLYLENFIVIDLEKYPAEKEVYLPAVYRETAKVFPGLTFDTMTYVREPDKRESFDDFKSYNLAVTLKKGSQSYRFSSFINAESKGKIITPERYEIPSEYYRIFNKMLADQLSDYRLHLVQINKNKFGILALTKKQFEGLMWFYTGMSSGGYINLSYENFTNKLTKKKIDDAIRIYDSIGLFSHLTKEEKENSITDINKKSINYFSDLLSSFKDLVFEIDLEYGVNNGQYRELTKQLADISKSHFNPVDIIDTYNYEKGKTFDFGFTLNGKKYLKRLTQQDDWLDERFLELIDEAVAEQDKAGKFYYVYPMDGMRLIYLTPQQAEKLVQLKIIELEEPDN